MKSSSLAILVAFYLGRSYGFSSFCPVAGFTVNMPRSSWCFRRQTAVKQQQQQLPRTRSIQQYHQSSLVILKDVPQDTLSETITSSDSMIARLDNIMLNGIHGDDDSSKRKITSVEIGSSSGNFAANGAADSNGVNIGTADGSVDKISEEEVAMPTENGGFTHTKASKAKISKANKGKVPWNKGRVRSEEEKARISAGVKARLRKQHLEKLEKLGITEEEWEAEQQKIKAEKARIKAEKQKRRTAKGGYTPTEETKRKISEKIKAKWAAGEVKPRPRKKDDPNWVHPRAGIGHTEKTKEKIRQTLKAKWQDPKYRTKMENAANKNSQPDARKRISETLKKKWEDPEFREFMMEKIRNRKGKTQEKNAEHRRKISETMKKKWEDPEYRQKAMSGIKKYNADRPPAPKSSRPKAPRAPKKKTTTLKAASTVAKKNNKKEDGHEKGNNKSNND
mmetsp:Transcript_21618/g.33065  ORF Transcript_21618/g.33065 Transcript_21618/m.33065 type:complete len:450 (-) Transcript_21618:103-1452(-)